MYWITLIIVPPLLSPDALSHLTAMVILEVVVTK